MTRYKLNIDKPALSDEKINKHKDFKKLYYNYHRATKPLYKTPIYKDKKVFLALLLILLLTYIIAEYTDKEKEEKKSPTEQSTDKP
jgi:hypothetical protein